MFFRCVINDLSGRMSLVGSPNKKDLINSYLCMVKALTRSQVDFLCHLHNHLISDTDTIEHNGTFWLHRTFDELADELGLCDRTINRIVSSLKQDNIILIEKLALHKTIRTNYYTINYPQLWKTIPESTLIFMPLPQGEAA